MKEFVDALKQAVGGQDVLCQEQMKEHTTFRVGGPAQYYVSVTKKEQLQKGILCCREYQVPYVVLGNGSNVLVSDAGISGVVFQMSAQFSALSYEEKQEQIYVTAEAGALLGRIGQAVYQEGLTGFEWAAGIPGTIGGAVYMNAGAYGGEMKDIVTSVTILDKDLTYKTLTVQELALGYRQSVLMKEEAYVVSVTFALQKGDKAAIKARMEELMHKRLEKQPLNYPSAGSTFKRPEGYFAGKLIEDAGLRGFRVGGAQVSEKHCGFVINEKNATAKDIYDLTNEVRDIVEDKFGVTLEREIRLLGEF